MKALGATYQGNIAEQSLGLRHHFQRLFLDYSEQEKGEQPMTQINRLGGGKKRLAIQKLNQNYGVRFQYVEIQRSGV